MNNKLTPTLLLTAFLAVTVTAQPQAVVASKTARGSEDDKAAPKTAYLMAYFVNKGQRLLWATSRDAKNWTSLDADMPHWKHQFVRDPYIRKVKGLYHMVHTTGMSGVTLAHWTSSDLINWTGGVIQVMPKKRGQKCWAPEFVWCEEEQLFYVHWSSNHPTEKRMVMYYTKTKDFKSINPEESQIYYDHGKHCIDLTIEKYKGLYYGFHQVGQWRIPNPQGNLMVTSKSLNPAVERFDHAGEGKDVFPNQQHPTEAVAGIKLIEGDKWYFYADPNKHKTLDLQAWETSDFKTFKEIKIEVPIGAKHCSMIQITEKELKRLQELK